MPLHLHAHGGRSLFSTLALLLIPLALTACADLFKEPTIGVPVGIVGHYGRNMGIPELQVNGRWIGNNSGWGGGGTGGGSIPLPLHPKGPVMIDVKWESCDISQIKFVNDIAVDPNSRCILEWHEATIPVNFAVEPGDSSGMYLHFFPGHKVEAWVSRYGPESTLYPGPAYPRGPAPINPPMPGKNPIPANAGQFNRP